MSETQPEARLSDSATEQILNFVHRVGVDSKYRAAECANNGRGITSTDELVLDDGMLTDPANVSAIIFDPENVPPMFRDQQHKLTEPAVDLEAGTFSPDSDDEYDYSTFTFDGGHKTAIRDDLLDDTEAIYGFDPRDADHPPMSHTEENGWPIRIDSDDGETYLLQAPLMVDY